MLVTTEVISTTDQWLKGVEGLRGLGWLQYSPWMTLVAILNPGLQGDDESTCHHELESSVNLAPDKRMPGVQAESRLAGTASTSCDQVSTTKLQGPFPAAPTTWLAPHGSMGIMVHLQLSSQHDFGRGLLAWSYPWILYGSFSGKGPTSWGFMCSGEQ